MEIPRALAAASALVACLVLTDRNAHAATAPVSAPATSPTQAAAPPARREDAAAQALFEQVLRRLSGYKDFQARFVESSESRAGTRTARESGQVYFKRPGLWRWEYTDPERKVVRVRGNGRAHV